MKRQAHVSTSQGAAHSHGDGDAVAGYAPDADIAAPESHESQNGALVQRVANMLRREGQSQSVEALVREVFGASSAIGGANAPWEHLLTGLLQGSSLFSRDGAGHWGLSSWSGLRQRLADVQWAVLDIETTGLAPGRHRIIEVGVVLVRGTELGASYQRLINPDRRIPQFITSFTGIRQTMVNRAKGPQIVLPELRSFLGERVVVGHNVRFDLGFLGYEAERLGLPLRFPDTGVDTIELARRYVTGMRRARLDRVATALHIPVHDRHRALGDARLTAQVFVLLLARAMEAGCETLDDLQQMLAGGESWPASVSPAQLTGAHFLNPAWRRDFPARPGVYLMKDEQGTVIYVGKAKCLRDRLASYYHQPLGYVRKLDGLIQSVRAIEVRVLGSELEALLVESRLIKALQPRFNVQLRNYEHYPFIKVDVQHAYPRIYATREIAADGARYFGPYRSGRIVDVTIELLHRVFAIRSCTRALPPQAPASEPCLRYHLKRCPAPCRGDLAPNAQERYRVAVEEACAFLGGERDDLLDRLRREMFAASARQDFERAARLRDALREADQVLLGQRLVSGAVDANNLLVVYPSATEGHREVFLVRHGRLIEQRCVAVEREALWPDITALLEHAARIGKPPDRVGREEVDEINIIARWVHKYSDEDSRAFFSLPRDLLDPRVGAAFVEQVIESICASETESPAGDVEEPPREVESSTEAETPE